MYAKLLFVLVAVIPMDGVIGNNKDPKRRMEDPVMGFFKAAIRVVKPAYEKSVKKAVKAMDVPTMGRYISHCMNPDGTRKVDSPLCVFFMGLGMPYPEHPPQLSQGTVLTSQQEEHDTAFKKIVQKLKHQIVHLIRNDGAKVPATWSDLLNACEATEKTPVVDFVCSVVQEKEARKGNNAKKQRLETDTQDSTEQEIDDYLLLD